MKIFHSSKRKVAVICLLLIGALVVSSDAYAVEQKGFLVKLWERFTAKASQEGTSSPVKTKVSIRETKPPAKVQEKVAEKPKEEKKGFFARMWENITKRFGGGTETSDTVESGKVSSVVVPEVLEQKEEVLYDTPVSRMSKEEVLGKIEKKLEDKPYLVDAVQGLSFKKSVMDGKMYYYYSPVNGIPEKIKDLDKNILESLLSIISSEDLRLGEVEIGSPEKAQGAPIPGGYPETGAAPYSPVLSGEEEPGEGPVPMGEQPSQTEQPSVPSQGPAGSQGPSASAGPQGPATPAGPVPQQPSAPQEDRPVPPVPAVPEEELETPEEEEEEREIPHTREEMLDVIGKRLKVFGEIEFIVPNLFSRETTNGDKQYYYAPDGGVALKLSDLDKGDLFDLYIRVNNEATRINTERILRQIQQQEQIMRQIQLQQMQQQQQQIQPPQPPPQPPRTPQVYTPPQPPPQHNVPPQPPQVYTPPQPPQTRQ